jgi:hypothetical protein
VDHSKLDRIVGAAQRAADARSRGYRERALKRFPWVCGRCTREFTRANVHELTVHHRDHDHHNNPDDGSNWELLCLYCHDNEHQRSLEASDGAGSGEAHTAPGTHSPFADLKSMLASRDADD